MLRPARFYAAVALLSGTVTAMQVLQTRLFSVTTWYHLSFIVISIAMFGLTLGALTVWRRDEAEARERVEPLAGWAALMCGIGLIFALLVDIHIPLVFSDFCLTMIALPIIGAVTGLPYYQAGVALSLCLTRSPLPIGKIYGFDLLGAAAGCLAALGLMWIVDVPSGLFIIASAALLAAAMFGGRGSSLANAAALIGGVALLAGIGNAALPRPLIYPYYVKNHILPESVLDFDRWNPISRVTVGKEFDGPPFLWGPSPLLPGGMHIASKYLIIDGDAGTVITKFDGHDWQDLVYLDFDVTNLAYHLPGLNRTAIIGVGGGRDLLSAKYYKVPDVTALDVNNIQIDLLRDKPEFRSYSNLYNQPGVTLVNAEARSWFRSNRQPFDLIQMSLIDTWAANGAGAFALSENGIYTQEAWSSFFDNLTTDGVFTVSRWFTASMPGEAARQVSLAMSVLLAAHVDEPRAHIFMASSGKIATMILSRSPLTGERLAALERTAADKQFRVLISPDRPGVEPAFEPFLSARSEAELTRAGQNGIYDLTPPTDMRPFFFNQLKFSHPLAVARLAFGGVTGTFAGHAKATFNLFVIIAVAALMTLLVIVLPLFSTLRGELRQDSRAFVWAGSAYFVLIGLGFMLFEISLLQCFGVFLGHPVYGLGVVLFSLILSTGIGSLLSERWPLRSGRSAMVWCLLTLLAAVALSYGLTPVFTVFGAAPIVGRAILCVAVLAPIGLLLGYGFPTGLRLTGAIDSRATAWFWGVNGAAGVLSSALAIAFNIAIGIDHTLLLAGLCYALLALPIMTLRRLGTTAA